MPLKSGTKLGPYEIVSPLGAGGMGEVYRARDTRLGRDVAIKALPAAFSADADRLRRFEQETRSVAALNHPNILSIYDVGQHEGIPFLVCELLEGETLRTVLNRGRMPQAKAIDAGVQTAKGLAATHERGIVHRDLKPENLFVTKEGRVKILDFGLAKLRHTATPIAVDPGATTLVDSQTAPEMVIGTPSYMAPEQVRGEAIDSRTDIFAFGAVLFEMLSGRQAFRRKTTVETMTATLNADPPGFTDRQHPISPALDQIVRRCLEKSPEQRFQSAKDLAFALEALSGTSRAATASLSQATSSRPWTTVVVSIITVIAALSAGYLVGRHDARGPGSFERVTFQRGYVRGARFAPDGQNVIYSAAWEGRPSEVFITHVGNHNARSLDLRDSMVVGVSAAGDIAVLTSLHVIRTTNWLQVGILSRESASGGAAREILEGVWDADISRDGSQFAVVRKPEGQLQLEYPIGKSLFKTNGYISHPRISPNGKMVAFVEHPIFGDDRGYVALADAKGKVKRLTEEAPAVEGLAWSSDGGEIWYAATAKGTLSRERMVYAVSLQGESRKILQVPNDSCVWDIASDGRLLFSNDTVSSAQLVASPASAPEHNVSVLGFATYGAISADGKDVAFSESGHGIPDDYLVFFRRLDDSPAVQLGEGSAIGMSPNGKYVVALVPSQPTKLRILPTGAGESHTFDIAPIQVDRAFVSWMPGAKEFIFTGHSGEAPPRGYRASVDGGPVRPVTKQEGAQFWNRISPNGKFVLASVGIDYGNYEIVDLDTGKVLAAPLLEGESPVEWDQDGRHVFVAREAEQPPTLFRVDTHTGRREVWKQIRPADSAGILSLSHFYVTPSGNAYTYDAARVLSALYVYSEN
jgi:serine/threonine protein kinase/Tol biopolymer transport system component